MMVMLLTGGGFVAGREKEVYLSKRIARLRQAAANPSPRLAASGSLRTEPQARSESEPAGG